MSGDGDIARFARQRSVRVVPRALLQVSRAGALDHDFVEADLRDLDDADGTSVCRRGQGRSHRGHGGGGRRRPGQGGGCCGAGVVLQQFLESLVQERLTVGFREVGSPQLISDEEKDHHAEDDEGPPDHAGDRGQPRRHEFRHYRRGTRCLRHRRPRFLSLLKYTSRWSESYSCAQPTSVGPPWRKLCFVAGSNDCTGDEAVTVGSVGILPGDRVILPPVVTALAAYGIDASRHRSTQMTAEALETSDLVVGLARTHSREAVLLAPDAWPRIFTLKELVAKGERATPRAPSQTMAQWLEVLHVGRRRTDLVGERLEEDVIDPMGGPPSGFARTAREIDQLIDRLVSLLWPGRDVSEK